METHRLGNRWIWVSCLWFWNACAVMGQATKPSPMDWSTLTNEAVSDTGTWVSYAVVYESGQDTVFVQSTRGSRRFGIPKGRAGQFRGDRYYYCLVEEGLHVVDLEQEIARTEVGVEQYWLGTTHAVLLNTSDEQGKRILRILNETGSVLHTIENVSQVAWEPNVERLAVVTEGRLQIVDCKKQVFMPKMVKGVVGRVGSMVWAHEGATLLFTSDSDADGVVDKVGCYFVSTAECYQYKVGGLGTEGRVQESITAESLALSEDSERVFFYTVPSVPFEGRDEPTAVQVWHAQDKELLPYRQRYQHALDRPRLQCWWSKTGKVIAIGSDAQPEAYLNGTQTHALVFDGSKYQPTVQYNPDRDYWIKDLSTGATTLVLKQFSEARTRIGFSPAGKYLVYFKERQWWVYDLKKKVHQCISAEVPTVWDDEWHDMGGSAAPYGVAGWLPKDEAVLLYDRYDVWEVSMNGRARRITHGREERTAFRLLPQAKKKMPPSAFYYIDAHYDWEEECLVQATVDHHERTGYYRLLNGRQLQLIVDEPLGVSGLKKAPQKAFYSAVVEDYDCAPQLHWYDGAGAGSVLYYNSRNQNGVTWGKSELITYTDGTGKPLKGVLFYPKDYDAQKQYPMIVSVYERQTHTLHAFSSPTKRSAAGFAKSTFTQKGYFVFYPDIAYEVGNPSRSALECVMNGVNAVLERVSVDRKLVGLIGHSYGGYETNCILTQTDFFKAAVSGASVSDLIHGYVTFSKSYLKTDYWRYENDQMRMGQSLFDAVEVYERNSPLLQAKAVSTPLLLWTGEEDKQVNPEQTMEFYLALRRLNKSCTMLVYPKEGHVVREEKNQEDLSRRIEEWFDYYLNNGSTTDWFLRR